MGKDGGNSGNNNNFPKIYGLPGSEKFWGLVALVDVTFLDNGPILVEGTERCQKWNLSQSNHGSLGNLVWIILGAEFMRKNIPNKPVLEFGFRNLPWIKIESRSEMYCRHLVHHSTPHVSSIFFIMIAHDSNDRTRRWNNFVLRPLPLPLRWASWVIPSHAPWPRRHVITGVWFFSHLTRAVIIHNPGWGCFCKCVRV